jgi:thioredoxin 1
MPHDVPAPGKVTMVDLGADKCIPCKMMAPIMAELEKEYQGRAAIVFLDVWKDKAPAVRFGIRGIPTQIFFDEKGNEVARHTGFLGKEEIVAQLKRMGVN